MTITNKNTKYDFSIFNIPIPKSLVLVLIVWLLLVAWRPFFFGFYHDDWSSVALPLDRSSDLLTLLKGDPGRPLYLIVLYGLRAVFKDHFEIWQLALALIHLFSAIGIYVAMTYLYNGNDRNGGRSCGAVAAVLWLVVPWSLGYSAWAVMLPPDLGMLLAICAIIVVVKPGINTKRVCFSIGLLIASWLIYEATWMVWFPFAVLLLVRSFERNELRRYAMQFFILALVAQGLFVVFNRIASTQSLQGKKLSANILATLDTDWHLFLNQLLPSLVGKDLMEWSLALLLVCVIANLPRWISSPSKWMQPICMLIGMATSVLIYAAAGYGIEWTGLFSRVTLSISFWLVFLFAGLFAMAWGGAARPVKLLALIGLLGVLSPLTYSTVQQSMLWKKSWDEQQQILRALPQSVINLANRQTLILVDAPRGTGPVYTFSAFWDISGAIILRMPEYVNDKKPPVFATMARKGEWRTTWDGVMVRQAWCHSPDSPIWGLETSKLYLWEYPAQNAVAVVAPYDSGCQSPASLVP